MQQSQSVHFIFYILYLICLLKLNLPIIQIYLLFIFMKQLKQVRFQINISWYFFHFFLNFKQVIWPTL